MSEPQSRPEFGLKRDRCTTRTRIHRCAPGKGATWRVLEGFQAHRISTTHPTFPRSLLLGPGRFRGMRRCCCRCGGLLRGFHGLRSLGVGEAVGDAAYDSEEVVDSVNGSRVTSNPGDPRRCLHRRRLPRLRRGGRRPGPHQGQERGGRRTPGLRPHRDRRPRPGSHQLRRRADTVGLPPSLQVPVQLPPAPSTEAPSAP